MSRRSDPIGLKNKQRIIIVKLEFKRMKEIASSPAYGGILAMTCFAQYEGKSQHMISASI